MRFPILILFWCVAAFGVPHVALAQESATERGWKIVPQGTVINEDYGAVGEVVGISGTVNGDVYAAGGQVFIDGVVDGDVLALGGIVHIAGEVTQNVRVAGGEVVVSGTVGRNATVAATHVTFTDSASVQGSVAIGGANIFLASPIGKGARIAGRNLTLVSSVEGDVEAAVDNVRIASEARIGGNVTYWSNKEALIDEGADIAGTTERKSPEQLTGSVATLIEPVTRWLKPVLGVSSFFTTLILGVLLIRLFPGFTHDTVVMLRERKWRSLTSGITVLLLIPVVFGILIITIVGIPLGFLLLLASSIILYVARIFVMLLIGQFILGRLKKQGGNGIAFFAGLVLYSILMFVPFVGWAVSFGAMLFGLGAILEQLKTTYAKARAEKASKT